MSRTSSAVDRAFEAALYTDGDAALDTGASLLAVDPASDAELDRRGRDFVATAWRRGWQPADVVRLVRRELRDPHVRLVSRLILDESRRVADDGSREPRSPRWAAQLAAIHDTPAVRGDRFTLATTALELYRLLLRLPVLEPLDDGARRPPTHPQHGDARMLTRIRALLAKAEATGYPEEAEALSAKAQELMARYSVDEALLAARAHDPNAPGAGRVGVEPPYETAKAALLDAVARANRCHSVWNEAFGFSTVVGFEADLEVVELLYTSLLVQATTAMTKAEAEQRRGGRRRTKTFRQSFLAAYAHRIGDRLAAVAEREAGQAAASEGELLPVLAARDVAVREEVDRMFPDTVTTRVRGVSDAAGWHQGAAAADRAQVAPRRQVDG